MSRLVAHARRLNKPTVDMVRRRLLWKLLPCRVLLAWIAYRFNFYSSICKIKIDIVHDYSTIYKALGSPGFVQILRRVWLSPQAGVPGRFGPRSIELSSESPLSFPLGALGPARGGIADAMGAAIHTDLPAHSHAGAPPATPLILISSHTLY